MRAFLTSSMAAEKLPKERFTPSNESEVMLKRVFSPRRFESTAAAAPLKHEWADGYSGCGGIGSSGVHVGSAEVSGFPSLSARGMAVIGLQKANVYLPSQQAMPASAISIAIAFVARTLDE
jgi:hypothetical protein